MGRQFGPPANIVEAITIEPSAERAPNLRLTEVLPGNVILLEIAIDLVVRFTLDIKDPTKMRSALGPGKE